MSLIFIEVTVPKAGRTVLKNLKEFKRAPWQLSCHRLGMQACFFACAFAKAKAQVTEKRR
jgi:hypothetical protein